MTEQDRDRAASETRYDVRCAESGGPAAHEPLAARTK